MNDRALHVRGRFGTPLIQGLGGPAPKCPRGH